MNRQEIIEAMEGHRCDLDALQEADAPELADALQQDAELSRRYERIRGWDQVVGQALHACPVPDGLCGRLLDALQPGDSKPSAEPAEASFQLPVQAVVADAEPAGCPQTTAPATNRRPGRRYFLWLAASLSVAALVLVSLWLNPFVPQTPQLTAEFADEIIDWTQTVARGAWNTDFSAPELRDATFDASIQAMPQRWTCIETRYAARTIVYDLTVRRNEPAYLFSFASGRTSLPASPPGTPFSTTGGFSIGVWQQGDRVYVLAVRGGERRYRGLIQSSVILGWMERDSAIRAIGRV